MLLYWYHWIAAYMMIIGGIAFTIVPEKPLWLLAVIVILIGLGVAMCMFLPGKPDKYADKGGH